MLKKYRVYGGYYESLIYFLPQKRKFILKRRKSFLDYEYIYKLQEENFYVFE